MNYYPKKLNCICYFFYQFLHFQAYFCSMETSTQLLLKYILVISVQRNMTYPEALDSCARRNASLPMADTQELLQDLLIKMKTNNLTSIWLGLHRQDLKKHQWSDNSILGKITLSYCKN